MPGVISNVKKANKLEVCDREMDQQASLHFEMDRELRYKGHPETSGYSLFNSFRAAEFHKRVNAG